MSLDSCNDVPISPLKALIAVHLTACTVYRKALFSSICNLLMCFLFRYILLQFHVEVLPIINLLQLLAIPAGIKFAYFLPYSDILLFVN